MEENGLSGLINIGNTCYINSIIQCLSNCDIFRDYIFNDKFIEHILYTLKKDDIDYEKSISDLLIYQFYKILKYIWNEKNINVKPTTFKKKLGKKFNFFDNYDQNDSQEFLQFLLNTFNDEIKIKIKISSNIISDDIIKKIKDFSEDELLEYLQNDYDKNIKEIAYLYQTKYLNNNYSVINYLFHGMFLSELTCPITNKISCSFEPFFMISIPIINFIENKNLLNENFNIFSDEDFNIFSDDSDDDENNIKYNIDDDENNIKYNIDDDENEIEEDENEIGEDENEIEEDENEEDETDDYEYGIDNENNIEDEDIYETVSKNNSEENSEDIELDIHDCLNNLFSEEKLTDDNKWKSPFCDEYVNPYKKIMIWNHASSAVVLQQACL